MVSMARTTPLLLALFARSGAVTAPLPICARSFAAGITRKDVVYNLDNTDDPEVQADIKSYLKDLYSKGEPAEADDSAGLELTAAIEKKYRAAQIVETGIQNVAVPLAYEEAGGHAAVKRYVSQLLTVASKAGFESPVAEVSRRLSDKAAASDTVKEFLNKSRALMSAAFHADLLDALAEVEGQLGASVPLDKESAAYKAFAEKAKAVATKHKLPWQLLVKAKTSPAEAGVQKEYSAWLQSAQAADAVAELEELKAEAVRVLDTHLGKTADQVQAEQASALAALHKRLEAARGSEWAARYKADLAYVDWFDKAVAANPAKGPVA